MNEPTTSVNSESPSRSRRIAVALAAVAAFTVAGGATVWALSPDGTGEANESTSASSPDVEVTTTLADATTPTAVTGDDHEGHGGGDDATCDLPVASHAGDTDRRHTLHDTTGGRAVTETDCDAAAAWFDEVSTAALDRFADLDDAIDAGYVITKQSRESPNPLDHYTLRGGNDAQLDADLPEGLVYWTDSDTGEAVLYGVVFIERGGDLPQPGGPLTVWHDHHDAESCLALDENCDLEAGAANAPRMLHVWFFDGVVDVFAHDYPGAVGAEGRRSRSR
jgi:hypothetical protein